MSWNLTLRLKLNSLGYQPYQDIVQRQVKCIFTEEQAGAAPGSAQELHFFE